MEQWRSGCKGDGREHRFAVLLPISVVRMITGALTPVMTGTFETDAEFSN